MINRIERAAVLLLLVCTACAQTGGREALVWEPLLFNATDQVPKGTIGKDIVSDLRVSDRTVVLEETKLTDLQAHFKAPIGNRGDAGDYVEWLCFYGANNNWVLWLTSGEIDAGAIGGFQLAACSCDSTNRRTVPTATGFGGQAPKRHPAGDIGARSFPHHGSTYEKGRSEIPVCPRGATGHTEPALYGDERRRCKHS
jgi:hypothetical protein